jgi:outer membrane protein TolC
VWPCGAAHAQITTLQDALDASAASNRAIRSAKLERVKAEAGLQAARTHRRPVFSISTLASQPLTQLGVTLEQGSLGIYPSVGPIPGRTTTLEGPLQFGVIAFASVGQPLTQQYRVGLGIDLARVGVEVAAEQLRSRRQSTSNEIRRIYYGIVQAQDARHRLKAAVDFLEQLQKETSQGVTQQVALKADLMNVDAQLAQAKYELLKLNDPIETQKQQLNRLMGRAIDTPFEVDPASVSTMEVPSLEEAYARATQSRPEIRLAHLQASKAQIDRRLKAAERIPDVSLVLSAFKTANLGSVLPRSYSSVGFQASWDVFDWGRKRAEIDAMLQSEQQALLDLTDVEAQVRIDVAHQRRRVLEARQQLEAAKARQTSATELLRVTRNRFSQREALLSDVLRVQSDVAEAELRVVQALMDWAAAQADFEKAMGSE